LAVIGGLLLCEHNNSLGQWMALAFFGLVPAAIGAYWILRSGHLAARSRARGYRYRPWIGSKLYQERAAVYILGGFLIGGFGLLVLFGSLAQRNLAC
jgi:hypothetical protein